VFMKLAVIGTGYVGLVSGVCFSEIGHHVTCVDIDAAKIATLSSGKVPMFEPGLSELISKNTDAGRLDFTTDVEAAVASAEAIFIAVGTPPHPKTGHADMTYVLAAAASIGRAQNGPKVVVIKSTVPVGTSEHVLAAIRNTNGGQQIYMASNPEFLREGAAIDDFMSPDRIVVGTETAEARDVLDAIYAPMTRKGATLLHTSIKSAELIKYASNAFLATKISFVNEMAHLCEALGADVSDVTKGMGLDARIGKRFLQPGPGYGGSCFPKDTTALAGLARDVGVPMHITEATIAVNDQTKLRMIEKIEALADGDLREKRIAVLGITFKPNTDDVRDAPALSIIPALIAKGATLVATDPEGQKHGEPLLPGLHWASDAYEAAIGADMLVVLTEWDQFATLSLSRLRKSMRSARLADLRNLYEPHAVRTAGFTHYARIGAATSIEAVQV
jgi:UDPglucose 6-dehydrogenase